GGPAPSGQCHAPPPHDHLRAERRASRTPDQARPRIACGCMRGRTRRRIGGVAPAVTVIMPVYDRERFVCEAIASVLAQTFSDLELIVVDDGSTDGTAAAVAAVEDPRLRYVAQPHRGVAAAMNTGLRSARGRYVARLDSDDVWLPDLLATQVAVLESRPEIDVVYARAQGMEADGTLTTHVWGIAPRWPADALRSQLHGDFTCNITTVARRACLERAGGTVSQPARRPRARAPRATRVPARARGVRPGLCERRESDRHRGPHRLVHARLAVPEPPRVGTAVRRLAASGPPAVANAARVVMIRFSLLHPSRGRLERAAQAIGEWTARRSGAHAVEHILSIDTDDDVAGYRRVAEAAGVRLVVNANRSVVDAANAAARAATGDVLIVVSDDFGCP